MSEPKVTATFVCTGEEMHLVTVEVLFPEFENGILVGGLLGSAKDFCPACDAVTETLAYQLVTTP